MGRLLTIDLSEMRSELLTRSFVRSSEAFGPTEDIFITREHGYRHIEDSLFLHLMNFEAAQPYRLRMTRRGLVCIQIIIAGTYDRWIGDRVERVSSTLTYISNQPQSLVDTAAGMRLRGLLIVCERQYLLDHYGLDVDRVPEEYRPIFTSDDGLAEPWSLPNLPATIAIADQLMTCRYPDPIKSAYIRAKTVELVCTIVANINMFSRRGRHRVRSPESKAEAIVSAASIYRREIHRPPTVEQLAVRVGMNRNDLTSGFRDMFGSTPHYFGLVVRMEEAQKLLRSGSLSISEVARRTGYEGYSSFSKAYQAFYGHGPGLPAQKEKN